ncbi:hypothetical protein QUF75_19450 [Desulfococcaceae bacterium HSG7]|nr:hypothetical protein [Desulfococcaceae bacterium HSG7]
MNKLTLTGLVMLFGSMATIVYQGVASMMYKGAWKMLTLANTIDEKHLAFINGISTQFVQNAAKFIIDVHLYILFICVGVICFILGMFIKVE